MTNFCSLHLPCRKEKREKLLEAAQDPNWKFLQSKQFRAENNSVGLMEFDYLKVGVQQGSCHDPLLFLVYINDLPCGVVLSVCSVWGCCGATKC